MNRAGQKRASRLAAMPRKLRKTLLACALAATIAGCGSDDGTIPSNDADQLLTQLDAIQSDIESGDCELAHSHAVQLAEAVGQLPSDVDPKVREGLTEASTHVVELSGDPAQCEQTTGATGETGATSTTTEETTTTEEPTTTTDEEPTTTTEQDQGQDEGNQGNGTSQGNSPLEVPGDNGAGNGGGRGSSESGGVQPGKTP
jgi:hypothetical protein